MVAMNVLRKQRSKYMQCILPDVHIIAANIVIILLYPYDVLKSKYNCCCVD